MNPKKFPVTFLFLGFLLVFAVLLLVLPKSNYSENEKRYLASAPVLSMDSISDGSYFSEFEDYLSDHFPFRDTFVGIQAYYELLTGRNGVSGVYKGSDGYLITAPGTLDAQRCERNARQLSDFAQKNNLSVSLILVPTAGYSLEQYLPRNHAPYNDDDIFRIAGDAFSDSLIDLRPIFSENLDKQLYYKTDHHLTAAGSYLMYQAFCQEKGLAYTSEFPEIEVLDGFYGTTYAKSRLWFEKPDTLEIWHPAAASEFEVTLDAAKGQVYDSLYFHSHDQDADKYPVYLDGNHPLVKIKNKSNANGKKLLILKDSYAHCFATFLCENYEEIYMVDLRYYRLSVSDLVAENEITELLCLYGAENFASLSDIGWLK